MAGIRATTVNHSNLVVQQSEDHKQQLLPIQLFYNAAVLHEQQLHQQVVV